MVKVKENLTGQVFTRLTVIKQAEDYVDPRGKRSAQWLCQCSCGSDPVVVRQSRLKDGTTKSCGCLHREISKQVCKINRHKINEYDLSGEYGIGLTSNTNEEFYFDLEDYDIIKDYCWAACEPVKGYIRIETSINNKGVNMAQLLTGQKDIDHIDRNPMNNRRLNLREATRSQQGMNRKKQSNNTSGFIGVYWDKRQNRWMSAIKIKGKQKHLGYFVNKNNAVIARLKAEKKYFGEFAPQRHLFEQYGINDKETNYEQESDMCAM